MALELPDYGCNDHIEADNEVGGPGVAASFILVSWFSILLAFFPAFEEAKHATRSAHAWIASRKRTRTKECKHEHQPPTASLPSTEDRSQPGSFVVSKYDSLVTLYFQLTLDSFWAARINYMDLHLGLTAPGHALGRSWRLQVWRVAVSTACILAVVWQFRIYFREGKDWDDGAAGPCNRYLDQSNPLFVLVFRVSGLVLFCFALVTTLFLPWAGRVTLWYLIVTRSVVDWLWGRFEDSLDQHSDQRKRRVLMGGAVCAGDGTNLTKQPRRSLATALVGEMRFGLGVALSGFACSVAFLAQQWLAVYSYGDGFHPLIWFSSTEKEFEWGFGQILPLVLTLSIVFHAVDVFSGTEPEGRDVSAVDFGSHHIRDRQ
ncbi:hypothetical protein B0T22DRAFT_445832 [Podospora appendiculata]|uniref:Uncharacterized protein n=1 Tax=Podospora appendiculata TaxID=314037 RepID=A0AAE1C702_9PEZI|nr:hypothetical protein B0T22DRAFT_445832 [Podospora appendiculata]